MNWGDVFALTMSPLELVVRGSAMYLFLFLLFRVVIRRRVGSVGMADILVLVIISDASQKMGALIDDLLAFSRIGRAEMVTSPVALSSVVDGVIRDLHRVLLFSGLRIYFRLDPL